MKDKKSKIQLIIIILELIILIGISGYKIYEYVNEENVEVVKYTVTFDYGNGTNRSIEVEENEKIELPSEPIKEGYIFGGWYYDGMLFDKNSIITDNIILKANWIERLDLPTIKILVDQINIRKEADENSEDIGDVLLDETYKVLETIEFDSYTWYKINKNGIKGYVANKKSENWVEYSNLRKHTISFYADNVLVKEIQVNEGTTEKDFIYSIEAPMKAGYIFKGWKNNEINNYTEIKKDIVYNAEYSKLYKLTLIYDEFYVRTIDLEEQYFRGKKRMAAAPYPEDYDSCNFDLNPCEYVYDDKGGSIRKTMKDGYEFIGWYTQDGEKFDWYIPETDELTLVAKYEKTYDDSYLLEYKKFETDEINAELIYELEQKILIWTNVGKCGEESFRYFDMIGKTEEYSVQDKVKNIIDMIYHHIKCGAADKIYDHNEYTVGCYIPDNTVEKMYKYVYGNDSYYEHGIKDSLVIAKIPMYGYNNLRNAYFRGVHALGTCNIGSGIEEKIVDVNKYDDRIEVIKKAINYIYHSNGEKYSYDYDDLPSYEQIPNGKELPKYNNFEEIQDKLDSYIFVFKKDSKDNYYLYEVKKEESK